MEVVDKLAWKDSPTGVRCLRKAWLWMEKMTLFQVDEEVF